MFIVRNALLIIIVFFSITKLFCQNGTESLPSVWDPTTKYSYDEWALVGEVYYISLVDDNENMNPPNNPNHWITSENRASQNGNPGTAPNEDAENFLDSLPDGNPDGNTTTTEPEPIKYFGNVHALNPGFSPGFRRDGRAMNASIPAYFDVDGYYDRNNDVRDSLQNFSNDDVQAWNHYLNDGIYEDRMFDNIFVPLEYLNIYTDLRVEFTDSNGVINLVKAVDHWFNNGRAEGRLGRFQIPSWFDAQQYMNSHNDVRDSIKDSQFGEETEAWWHFYRIGAPKENRSWNDEEFTLDAYIALSDDLKVTFKSSDGSYDKRAAMYHYIYAGYSEGRPDTFSVPTWFNSTEYLDSNPDVKSGSWGTSPFKAFNHFFRFGSPIDNRELSNFSLDAYMNYNVDVVNSFKSNRFEILIHYISDGFSENRRALE
jgi:hypothetical protein